MQDLRRGSGRWPGGPRQPGRQWPRMNRGARPSLRDFPQLSASLGHSCEGRLLKQAPGKKTNTRKVGKEGKQERPGPLWVPFPDAMHCWSAGPEATRCACASGQQLWVGQGRSPGWLRPGGATPAGARPLLPSRAPERAGGMPLQLRLAPQLQASLVTRQSPP